MSLLIIHFYSHCKLFIQISCRPFLIKDNFFSITQSTLAVFVCICSYGSLCCQTRWLPASFSDLWTLTRLRRSSLDVKRVKVRFSLKVLNEIITERWAETVRVLLVWIRRKTVTVMESFLMKINGCFVSHIWAVFRVALSLLFCGQYCVIFLWGSYFPKFLPKLIGKYFI